MQMRPIVGEALLKANIITKNNHEKIPILHFYFTQGYLIFVPVASFDWIGNQLPVISGNQSEHKIESSYVMVMINFDSLCSMKLIQRFKMSI